MSAENQNQTIVNCQLSTVNCQRTAIVGINWGDEGKGRMVDLLSADYPVICRYQGGNNAGHTVINDKGEFILNLLPSGILRDGTTNVMGAGMVIDLKHLAGEIKNLSAKGIAVTPERLKISDKATICLPYHPRQDVLEEDRLRDKQYGSTRRGIAPVYADKYMKKTLRMSDLTEPAALPLKVADLCTWKNLTMVGGYGAKPIDPNEVLDWLHKYGDPLLPYITCTTAVLTQAEAEGRSVLFEAQLGALRDIDYGIYPFTSSSSTIAAYAPIGAGIPGKKLDKTIGIMKAYSSCVGEGPFVAEMFGAEAEALRQAGGEYGAATGRPRRVGGFDIPASRYGCRVQGADEIALTKLDVLSYLDEIPIVVAYEIDGKRVEDFPVGDPLFRAKPIVETMPGWKTDIGGARSPADLPAEALDYIRRLQDAVGVRVSVVSVGPKRDDYLTMDNG